MNRCCNLDWLEVYAIESERYYPQDAEFFRSRGYWVRERDYGTRVFKQMFTLVDDHETPYIEIRRLPVGAFKTGERCIIDPYSVHIRLANQYCYRNDAAQIMIEFLNRNNYTFRRISRVDICLDFIRFDSGDDPAKFIDRYLRHKYAKINQANLSAHGKDQWDGIKFNSLSWGSPSSCISTKLYDKTMEIREVKDKPYIRQAWFLSELVDNPATLIKAKRDGTTYSPRIWRLEFSIRSSLPGWMSLKTVHGEPNKYQSIPNTLDLYTSRQSIINIFSSIVYHYFSFVYYEKDKRKYDCQPKPLFNFDSERDTHYKVAKIATATPVDPSINALIKRLEHYKITHPQPELIHAADTILNELKQAMLNSSLSNPYDRSEQLLLQQLIALRMQRHQSLPLEDDRKFLESLMNLSDEIF